MNISNLKQYKHIRYINMGILVRYNVNILRDEFSTDSGKNLIRTWINHMVTEAYIRYKGHTLRSF